jgi:hypothetical protein
MNVGNPIPWGRRKRWSIFFLKNERKYFIFSLFSAQASTPSPGHNFPSLRPGLGKSKAQNSGLRPPGWSFEMPRGPGFDFENCALGRGCRQQMLIGEKVVNALSFVLNLNVPSMYAVLK